MKGKILYDFLYHYCCRDGFAKRVDKLLREEADEVVDLTYSDGLYFRLAMNQKSSSLMNILLKYYEETQLNDDTESLKYKVSKYKLINILQDAYDSCYPSEEVRSIISPYTVQSESEIEDYQEEFQIDIDPDQGAVYFETISSDVLGEVDL